MKFNKLFILFTMLVALSGYTCNKGNNTKELPATNCFKGRLEIKGLCMNYTIKVLTNTIDKNLVVASWQDPSTNKTYQNVFALGNVCNFPATIKEGDEFYFTLDENPKQDCMVCQAYYPTPEKRLSIAVTETPCYLNNQ